MSGGYFNYENDSLCDSIFNVFPDYGDRGFAKSSIASKRNPLGDREISELVYDVFCLLHSFDWYKECDIGEEDYRKDVKTFKEKWLRNDGERAKRIIDETFEDAKRELYKTYGIEIETIPLKPPHSGSNAVLPTFEVRIK